MSEPRGWMTVAAAAAFLSVNPVTLRRSLERNARPAADGGTVSYADGVSARKLGRMWRVRLDAVWFQPHVAK